MRKNVKLFNIIKIDFSFLILLVLAFLLDDVKVYFLYVFFIILHELTHYFVAKKLGYLPQKIHFTFFGASLEGYDDFLFRDEIKIVLAGPVFNFCIIILCYILFWFYPESFIYLNDVLIVNLSILLFNILPIFPLDAGRFILAILSKNNVRNIALKKTKTMSFVFVIVLFFIFLISFFFEYNFTLGFVCVNLFRLLFLSSKETSYKRQYFVNRKLKFLNKGLYDRTIYVSKNVKIFELFKFIDDSHFFNFIFLDSDGNIVNSITEIELYKICEML